MTHISRNNTKQFHRRPQKFSKSADNSNDTTPCNRGDFNLNGGPYKKCLMMFLLVTEIFQIMLFFKILNEGFMVNQYSKTITKPEVELHLYLALQQDILTASAFYTKR